MRALMIGTAVTTDLAPRFWTIAALLLSWFATCCSGVLSAQSASDPADPYFKSPAKVKQPQKPVEGQTPRPTDDLQDNEGFGGETFEQGRVLARVGGHPIFVADLLVEASQIAEQIAAGAPPEVKAAAKQNLIVQLLPKYIEAKLLFIDVKNGLPEAANFEDIIKSADDQFDEKVLPKMMEAAKVKSPAMLDAHFRALGSSLRKVRRSWSENELVKFVLRDKIQVNAEVSHREMYDYYLEHKSDYEIKPKVRWEQLMVRFKNFPTRDEALAAIVEMGNEVVYGASLAGVAKKKSQGYEAQNGGQQGWTTKGSLRDKDLDQLLFTIEPGKLSEIIATDQGFHIVRVMERSPEGFVPFAEAQSDIREKLMQAKREAVFREHLAKIRERIPVEIYEPAAVASQVGQNTLK